MSQSSSNDRRSPSDYRPSYKVNKKLEVMEKMGLQIKTPDGSMATAQQLRAAASDAAPQGRPTYFNQGAMSSHRILDQVCSNIFQGFNIWASVHYKRDLAVGNLQGSQRKLYEI